MQNLQKREHQNMLHCLELLANCSCL